MLEEDDLSRRIGLAEPLGCGVHDCEEKDRGYAAPDPNSDSIGGHGRRCGRRVHRAGAGNDMRITLVVARVDRASGHYTYLDRADPRLVLAKFLASTFMRGLFGELSPGSNCPGRVSEPGRSAPALLFLAFRAAFAFARWRALAFVMSSSPLQHEDVGNT